MENKEFSKKLEERTRAFAIRIIRDLKWSEPKLLESILDEANELLAIFTSIGKNLKL